MPRTRPPKSLLYPRAVASRIRRERERLGLSPAEAARRIGVTRQTYATLETAANPQLSRLITLVRLGMRPEKLAPELFEAGPGD